MWRGGPPQKRGQGGKKTIPPTDKREIFSPPRISVIKGEKGGQNCQGESEGWVGKVIGMFSPGELRFVQNFVESHWCDWKCVGAIFGPAIDCDGHETGRAANTKEWRGHLGRGVTTRKKKENKKGGTPRSNKGRKRGHGHRSTPPVAHPRRSAETAASGSVDEGV